jgi:D-alanyl-D-alanine carboxypeptidase/D-alanyl-D-alanine-endopeptidase (penicillin-binding protein 4)
MPGRAVRALVALATLAAGLASESVPAPVHADTRAVEPTTPVLSLRRVPGFVTSTIAAHHLVGRLEPVVDDPALGAARERSCISVRDPDGRTVFSRNATMPLIPASTMKLETATAAVARLGPGFHFTTEVRAAASPAGGTVAGDLWLVGSGDPLLATADFAQIAGYQRHPRPATPLETLADRVVGAGIRHVQGRVVGDESRYDTQRYLPTWNPRYATDPEIGPQSALTVNGGFVQWEPKAVPAPAPATNAAGLLTRLLRDRGVIVDGEASEGRAEARTPPPVATVDSPPLSEVVGVMLQESDNLAAELLVKELGARYRRQGSTGAGVEVVKETLASLGLGAPGMTATDGSGLDRSDRLTCDLLQATLAQGGEQGVVGRGLPVAGRSGTLARRFGGSPAAGKVRAKTGSLEGVTGLSGWTTTQDGRSVQFSLLVNDLPRDGVGTALQDRVVSALATWPEAPRPTDVGPRPPAVPSQRP